MTLPASGPISVNDIATEFGIPNNSVFPTAFYGKGGAPASGPLALEDFYGRSNAPSFSVDVSPLVVSGFGSFTNVCTATVTGGIAPYTYAWAVTTLGSFTISATNPTASSTSFHASMPAGNDTDGTAHVTVTDSTPGTPLVVVSDDVSVYLSR